MVKESSRILGSFNLNKTTYIVNKKKGTINLLSYLDKLADDAFTVVVLQ